MKASPTDVYERISNGRGRTLRAKRRTRCNPSSDEKGNNEGSGDRVSSRRA